MVRRKGTQKVKSKCIKSSAASSKVVKKAIKSTSNLGNGFKNTTEALIESDNVELSEPAETIVKTSIEIITETKSISSSKSSDSIKLETATEFAIPEIGKDATVANENEDQTVNDRFKVKESVNIIFQSSKSRKRKAVPIKKEVISANEASTKSKTKKKKGAKSISISNSSDSIKLETATDTEHTTPGIGKDATLANENQDQTVNYKFEIEESVKIVSQPSKSQKRKAVPIKEEVISADEASTKSKTGEKKRKSALEVPSLNSLPSKVFVVGENDVGQLGLTEDNDCKEKPLLDLPRSIVVPAGGMHYVCLAKNGENQSRNTGEAGQHPRVRRYKPTQKALKEIRKYQSSTDLILRKLPFARLIKEITMDLRGPVRWEARALQALQVAAVHHIVTLFEEAYLWTVWCGRDTLELSDLKFARLIRGRYKHVV